MYVAGFGYKGEGKSANYGTLIAAPSVVSPAELAQIGLLSSSSAAMAISDAVMSTPKQCPDPIPATFQQIETWLRQSYRPLEVSHNNPPEIGECVLWRGVRTGKSGQPSTTVEYFNGTVRYLKVTNEGELYVYVD